MDSERWDLLTFDCYGTLIDWESGLAGGIIGLLPNGHSAAKRPDELLARFAAHEHRLEAGPFMSYRDVLGRIAHAVTAELGVDLTDAQAARLAEGLPGWPPFDDTVAALATLATLASRFRLGVLSNVDDDLFAGTARGLGVAFDPIVTAQQVGSYKPAVANFHALLARAGVPAERVLHVAQSRFHDIAPATELGLETVWVDRRQGREGGATPPAAATPTYTVPDLATLAERLVGP